MKLGALTPEDFDRLKAKMMELSDPLRPNPRSAYFRMPLSVAAESRLALFESQCKGKTAFSGKVDVAELGRTD